jgi:DNA topoisomerase IB
LREVDVAEPGFRRRGAGKGFVYLDCEGRRIADQVVIARIKALAIPPAWTDVWICPDRRGHIQAMGLDARGRRQYRYHDEWRATRDREKHDRMLRMARALPRLRRRLRHDLATEGMGRDRVLACAVRLLELGMFRVGTEAYAEDNGTYGLATVRKGHVRARGDELRFAYPAKGGQRRVIAIGDPEVADVVRALKRRRGGGPELLAYKDERGRWMDVRSSNINAYLQDALGAGFSTKDFRTWTATVLAAVGLASEEDTDSQRQRRLAVRRVVRSVARQLGNTPAVTRGSYVDPRVIQSYENGDSVGDTLTETTFRAAVDFGADTDGDDDDDDTVAIDSVPPDLLTEIEAAVVELIEGASHRTTRRHAAPSHAPVRHGRPRNQA